MENKIAVHLSWRGRAPVIRFRTGLSLLSDTSQSRATLALLPQCRELLALLQPKDVLL